MPDLIFDIGGRVVMVTGAGSGLGRMLALALAGRGAALELVDVADGALDAACADCGSGARAIHADITREDEVARAMTIVMQRRRTLDAVVNCAGIFRVAPALDLPLADLRAALEVNVAGAFNLSRAAASVMGPQGGGSIVHLASVSSQVSNAGYAAYASSKAALTQLVRVLAREWAPGHITVNAIGPAMTETGMTRGLLSDPAARAAALSVIPMGRFGTPDDLVGALLLLISPAGRFITGQTIYVDGGRTLV